MNEVQNHLNFTDTKRTGEGVKVRRQDKEVGEAAVQARKVFDKVQEINPQFQVLIHKGKRLVPWVSNTEQIARTMAQDIVSRLGLKARGVSTLDRVTEVKLPDGRTFIANETFAEAVNAMLET